MSIFSDVSFGRGISKRECQHLVKLRSKFELKTATGECSLTIECGHRVPTIIKRNNNNKLASYGHKPICMLTAAACIEALYVLKQTACCLCILLPGRAVD